MSGCGSRPVILNRDLEGMWSVLAFLYNVIRAGIEGVAEYRVQSEEVRVVRGDGHRRLDMENAPKYLPNKESGGSTVRIEV